MFRVLPKSELASRLSIAIYSKNEKYRWMSVRQNPELCQSCLKLLLFILKPATAKPRQPPPTNHNPTNFS